MADYPVTIIDLIGFIEIGSTEKSVQGESNLNQATAEEATNVNA